MAQIKTTEPDDEAQEILNTWRIIFEQKYSEELDRFALYEEDVFGFEVQWKYLKNTPLHSIFPNNPIIITNKYYFVGVFDYYWLQIDEK